jgi:plastocyanin
MTRRTLTLLLSAALLLGLSTAAAAEGGTITGKVDVTPVKYLEETVVYLKQAPAAAKPQTHAMDQQRMTFVPHVLVVAVGDTVKFLNHDNVVHNVYSQNEERAYTFAKPGAYSQLCSIHPEMLGFVYVAPSSHAAAVDKQGGFTLKNVPPGTYTLAVWNSHFKGAEKSVTVAAGKTVTENLTVKR